MSIWKKWILALVLVPVVAVAAYVALIHIPLCPQKKGMTYYSRASSAYTVANKATILDYCQRNGFNTHYCFLVDYSIKSGTPRFFIFDLTQQRVVYSCLCAHGMGGGSTARTPVFSNSEGSLCSSLGRFVITGVGSRSYKNCFRLKGLDPINCNAASRGILIHAGRMVTYHKWLPYIPLSKTCEGCLTITKSGLRKLHEIYNREENKRILIYSFYGTKTVLPSQSN